MAKSSTKHENAQIINLGDFSGGLNLVTNAESIADNELQQADNLEYDATTGRLRVAAGFTRKFTAAGAVRDFWHDYAHDVFLYRVDGNLCCTDPKTETNTTIGALTGTSACTYACFGDDTFIASGGYLQKWTGPGGTFTSIEAKTPEGKPLYADMVFTQYGRLRVMCAGQDYMFESGIGDASNWTFTGTNTMDAKRLEVGYKDSGDIVAYSPLVQDVMVFKDNLRTYRITGEYSSDIASTWSCLPFSENIHCANSKCALQAGNDVFVFGKGGFINLSTVTEYGSIKQSEAGRTVNGELIEEINVATASLYRVNSRQQIWVQPNYYSPFIYVYHLSTGKFTRRRLYTGYLGGISERGTECYVAIGDKIFLLDDDVATEDGIYFYPTLRTKRWQTFQHYLIKLVVFNYYSIASGLGLLQVGNISLPFEMTDSGVDIYGDDGDIYGDAGEICEVEAVKPVFGRRNYKTQSFEVYLQLTKGSLGIVGISVQVVEVS